MVLKGLEGIIFDSQKNESDHRVASHLPVETEEGNHY